MNLSSQLRHTRAFARVLAALLLLVALAGYAPRALAAGPAPFALEFDGSDNGATLNTFLTTVLPGTNAPNGGATVNIALPGKLIIQTTSGELTSGATAQDNALALPYTSSGAYTIQARLIGPLPFAGPFQSGGIYIGQDQRSYIRFTAGFGSKRSSGERLQLDVMDHGKLRSSVVPLPPGTLASANQSLDLFLTFDHSTNRVSALYCINCADSSTARLASTRAFPRWLRQGNTVPVYGGVLTTSRGAQPISVVFDWFRLTAPVTAVVTGSKTVDKDGLSGPPVNPGDTLTYTISVTNNGGTGTSIQIADLIPVDTTFLSLTPPAAGTAQFDGANNRVTWQIASLGAGQTATFKFQVSINQPPLQSATILNTAAMTSGGSGFPALLSAATVVGVTPDLSDSIYTATPATVGPNGTVTYALNLLNDGTATANNAIAQLSIPSGTTYVQGSAQASSGTISLDPSLTQINWTAAGPLAINDTAAITFTVRVGSGFANGAPISSQAIMQANGVLPNIETAQAIFSVPASVTGTKTVDKPEANPGETLTYTLKVSNNSGTAANSLQVVDPIPQDTGYITGSLTLPAVGTATYDSANKRMTWQIPSLGASQTVTISLKVAINALPLHSSVILNRAILTNPSATVSQTLLTATTVVRGVADLSDSIYTASPATVGANGTITYTLNLLNDGTMAAANATASLTIPNVLGVTLVPNSAKATSGSVSQSGAQLNWVAGGALPIGAVVPISFQMKINGSLANSQVIASTATMQATGTLPTIKTARATYSSAGQAPHYLLYISVVYR